MKNEWQADVQEFHEETHGTVGETIAIRDRELRAKLIMEEAVETVAALGFDAVALIDEAGIPGERPHREIARFRKLYTKPHLVDFIDGMCDLLYVVIGSAVAAGVDLDPHFSEVHRANMTKTTGPVRDDGKQLKPDGWTPPDHERILIAAFGQEEEWARLEAAWKLQAWQTSDEPQITPSSTSEGPSPTS
jgi:predicted HAD superfamily Cof-like phosphohydrolase